MKVLIADTFEQVGIDGIAAAIPRTSEHPPLFPHAQVLDEVLAILALH